MPSESSCPPSAIREPALARYLAGASAGPKVIRNGSVTDRKENTNSQGINHRPDPSALVRRDCRGLNTNSNAMDFNRAAWAVGKLLGVLKIWRHETCCQLRIAANVTI